MMTKHNRSQFIVRDLRADSDELAACIALDHTYHTDHVWQMDIREENEHTVIRFRTVRLPRLMEVAYPHDQTRLPQIRTKSDCFLVAVSNHVVLGYVTLQIDLTQPAKGWIHDLVVGAPFRHRKIGSALLEQATRWAQLHDVRHISLEVQTKNYPAIQFIQKYGYVFCGFNDHYYNNQDIAVFFTKTI